MLFQPSCFILNFIFSMNLVLFYAIFYNDVTHFSTDRNENYTAYVNKRHFVRENFLIFGISIENIIKLHLSPIKFGLPIRVGSVRDSSFT